MQSLNNFWQIVLDVWRTGIYGIDVSAIIVALGIFIAFLVFRQAITAIILTPLKIRAKKSANAVDDNIVEVLEGPVRMIPVTMGFFFAAEYMKLDSGLAEFAHNLVRSLIAFIIFWALYRMVNPLSQLLGKLEKVFTPALVDWLVKAIKIMVALIGAATILELWGIKVGPILAGLGLFGVAVALGAQDLFKNLIAGILILAERRFNKGDWIRVDGVVEGTVENIGFRSTMIRRFDKAPVYVPNTKFSDSAVTNFTAMTHRRIYWHIGVEYSTTIEQLRTIRDQMENYILENNDFANAPEVSTFVRIDRFSDSSIDIMLYCFTNTTVWGEWLEIKEALAYKIKEIVEGAGSGFAFPSQTLYIENIPGERPETFVPPKNK
ncbi:MAG: mechanosensitive ion channel family protein [Rhodospirillaceae bacterium]|nr:mechanosensitive ion channel family protein [Rhodospirillaceae bacterium]